MNKCIAEGCEKAVISIPGRRPKQYCSVACRQKEWLKRNADKPKKTGWKEDIEAFCEKKGFLPSELIEKFEELEAQKEAAERELTDVLEGQGLIPSKETKNKLDTAPKSVKRTQDTPQFKMGRQKAEKGLKIEYEGEPLTEKDIIQIATNAKKGYHGSKEHFNHIANGRDPKNLDEVKALCPANLKGIDRSVWIAENRKLYNI